MSFIVAVAQSASFAGDVEKNVAHHLEFAKTAAEHGARLLLFPELSLTGYEPTLAANTTVGAGDPRLDPLRSFATESQMTIVAGAPIRGDSGVHIAAHVIFTDGSTFTYTKHYLHPGEERWFAPGPGGPVFEIHGRRVALAICAEISHPEHAAEAARNGASIYAAGVLITRKGYDADAALVQGYARTHRMTALMANHAAPTGGYTPAGGSAVWSPTGDLIARAGDGEALVLADLDCASSGRLLNVRWQSLDNS
jgi:predicted amidohydrolase